MTLTFHAEVDLREWVPGCTEPRRRHTVTVPFQAQDDLTHEELVDGARKLAEQLYAPSGWTHFHVMKIKPAPSKPVRPGPCDCDREAHQGFVEGDPVIIYNRFPFFLHIEMWELRPRLQGMFDGTDDWRYNADHSWRNDKILKCTRAAKARSGEIAIYMGPAPDGVSTNKQKCVVFYDGAEWVCEKRSVHHANCEKARGAG